MESLNVRVVHKEDGSVGFIGLDPKKGTPVTSVISDPGIRYPSEDVIASHAADCKGKIKTREKQRAANITRSALKKCQAEDHFRHFMAKSGIYVRISRNVNGQVFGVTLVDHKTKCVFKASELGLKAADFQELKYKASTKGHPAKARDEKEKAAPSVSSESELGKDVALVALAAVGVERNRHYIDEQIMRKARKKR